MFKYDITFFVYLGFGSRRILYAELYRTICHDGSNVAVMQILEQNLA